MYIFVPATAKTVV